MADAYYAGWDMFNLNGYNPVSPGLTAGAFSQLAWTGSEHYYQVVDTRVRAASVDIPLLPQAVGEILVPFWSGGVDSSHMHTVDEFRAWRGADFSGDENYLRIGDLGTSSFVGWLLWEGSWNNVTIPFSYKWPNIMQDWWGGLWEHWDYLDAGIDGYRPLYGGFWFDGSGGPYRNGLWLPVHTGEWGVAHH
jgi:hypothetical protein